MQPYEEQPLLAFPTDTAQPVTPVPIFYLHGGERAFCTTPGCICHHNDRQLEALLRGIISRDLKVRQQVNSMICWEVTDGHA